MKQVHRRGCRFESPRSRRPSAEAAVGKGLHRLTARVNLRMVGRVLDAFIDLRLPPTINPDDFERPVTKLPAVREVAFVTGRFDYQVRAACIDMDDLDHTVRALRQRAGAAQTETRIILRST